MTAPLPPWRRWLACWLFIGAHGFVLSRFQRDDLKFKHERPINTMLKFVFYPKVELQARATQLTQLLHEALPAIAHEIRFVVRAGKLLISKS